LLVPFDLINVIINRFRWVFCQLDKLRRCLSPRIRRALDELPETLDETYERTLLDIDDENWEYAHRHVRKEEVSSLKRTGVRKTQETWVLFTCSSLIAVVNVDDSPVMQFSHFAVKEYLTSNRVAKGRVSRYYIPLEPAHLFVTQACFGVLWFVAINHCQTSSYSPPG
jgi:hypothetical protein